MSKIVEKIKDILYDSFDYVVMLLIVVVVIGIIGWRLDVLFASNNDTPTPPVAVVDRDEPKEEPDEIDETDDDPVDPDEVVEAPVETPIVEVPPVVEDPPLVETPAAPTGEKIKINIPAGSLPGKIGTILADSGLIDSNRNFIAKAVELKLDTKLKSGDYSIAKGSSYEEILRILTK